ncbi:hypothetical protein M408DRAFT_21716 [Serendipita vermifera MAFF 305830]|uniref:Uncharacterized protein n=1 Tax=Serendipita vermifera MAFF 305830 TaxID=933852 RepID=A0A0C3BHE5_SERVB|nr:hypothetical protein M408DRAFT_21716 [Serendipita vermifera MAFF 305830]
MASTTGTPVSSWPVNSQGTYDAHSRARRELWRAPTGYESNQAAPSAVNQNGERRSVDDEGWAQPPRRGLMNHQNKSTPALQQPPAYDTDPAAAAYDPSQLNFDALHLSDPPPRGASSNAGHYDETGAAAPPTSSSASSVYYGQQNRSSAPDWVNLNAHDPIARTGTAMSYNSYAGSQAGHASAAAAAAADPYARNPRHAHTLPATGWQPPVSGGSGGGDGHSIRSFDQGQGQQQPHYSSTSPSYYEDPNAANSANAAGAYYDPQQQGYYGGQQQQYQGQGYDQYGQYSAADYNQQYAAYYGYNNASGQYPQYTAGTDYSNGGYVPPGGYDQGGYDQAGYDQGGYDQAGAARPHMERAQGTISDMSALRTQKVKAVDISQPPYTREYVEQYRARIKGDPDPEAHFAYAKYLIDAAKKIGARATDQRAVRKYRETLLAEALKTIRRLATQGEAYAEAQFFLANCCGSGLLGLQVDHERAYHLYLQAAKQNHPSASYRVAVCNELGVGTRKDASRAFAFYRKAASLGDTAAMYKLGMILLSGSLGQPKNTREAIGWLKRAAEQADEDNPHALHELGLLHEAPNSNVVVHDEAYAKDLFTKAGQLGFAPSQYKLGFAYEYGLLGCPIDPKRSIAWYTKAAEKGHPEAELALSGWYLTGSEGVLPQSDAEAYLWARRAANKGLSKAEFAVGYYAEQAIGVKQDIEFAKRWYMRAAAQGNKRAMSRLTELKRAGAGAKGGGRIGMARPTRQEAQDEGCIVM